MATPNLSLSDYIGMFLAGCLGVLALLLGREHFITGVMSETGEGFRRTLSNVNLLNMLLRRPEQEHLTRAQVRGIGFL